MLAWMLGAAALAADVRLVVVGDTGAETPVAAVIATDVARVVGQGGHGVIRVVAPGDLYYPSPPSSLDPAACVDAVTRRYRAFYGGLPAGLTLAVVGNHDVAGDPYRRHALDPRAWACTEGAFRALGWLGPAEGLGARVVRLDAGDVTADVALVDWGMFGEVPAGVDTSVSPGALRDHATFRVAVAHYALPDGLTSGKCPEDAVTAGRGLARAVPGPDVWLNGHAHHLEARLVDGVLDVTSGGGHVLRPHEGAGCGDVAGSAYRYTAGAGHPSPLATVHGGYTLVDLDLVDGVGRVVVTPVGCSTVSGGCAPILGGITTCTRRPEGRGVSCR